MGTGGDADAARDERGAGVSAVAASIGPVNEPATPTTTRMSYRDAVREAIRAAMRDDPRVFLMGEDVGRYGGTYAVSRGLIEEFGPERIRDTPLSESAFVGMGI